MDVAMPPQRPAAAPVPRPQIAQMPPSQPPKTAAMPVAPAPPHVASQATPSMAAAVHPDTPKPAAHAQTSQLPLGLITVTLFAMLVLSTLAIIIYLTSTQT